MELSKTEGSIASDEDSGSLEKAAQAANAIDSEEQAGGLGLSFSRFLPTMRLKKALQRWPSLPLKRH